MEEGRDELIRFDWFPAAMSGSSSSVLAERLNRTLTTHNENLDVAVAPVTKSSSSSSNVTASADDSNDDVLLACIANDDADVTQLPLLPRTVYAHRSVDSTAGADVDVDVDARARAMTMYCAVACASDRQALIGELDQLSSKCGSFVSLFALELRLIRL
jgi:hypothetical protein